MIDSDLNDRIERVCAEYGFAPVPDPGPKPPEPERTPEQKAALRNMAERNQDVWREFGTVNHNKAQFRLLMAVMAVKEAFRDKPTMPTESKKGSSKPPAPNL